VTLRGLLVDYGGVLTTDVFASFDVFCAQENLPVDAVRALFRREPTARELLVGLEDGSLADEEFETRLADLLGVPADRLIERMLGNATADLAMLDAVRAARRRGVRTGLVSNSWGVSRYDRVLLGELFDGVVISAEVGVRKPDPEIYAMGARAVGLAPAECAYVDDLGGNLKPARDLGMATVLHRDASGTIAELERLFGVPLAAEPAE
jgi:epoxide hydrolase-like predicted phosphatase